MGIKITKAEYDALPDSLKTKFKADGEDFELLEEDVEGLKKSKADILKEKKDLQDKLDEALKFKSDHEKAVADADDEKQRAAGEFEALEKKLRDKIAEVEADRDTKINDLRSLVKSEKVKNYLAENGVIAERAKYALNDVLDEFELTETDTGFGLKMKDGIGNADEMTTRVAKLKEASPFLFSSTTSSGGGAPGSGDGGGSSQKWSEMSRAEKTDAIRKHDGDTEAAMKAFG